MADAPRQSWKKMGTAIRIHRDLERLWTEAAGYIADLAGRSVGERGTFSLALSGGRTPRAVYDCLGHPDWQRKIPWSGVDVYWTDERCVDPDSPDSNFRLAHETLLSKLVAHPRSVHRPRTELRDPNRIAEDYEIDMRRGFGASETDPRFPRFDLLLLGMGADGHTASLFPGTPALDESRRWVIPGESPTPPLARITMTLPLLNQARHVLFLVEGASKATTLAQVLDAPHASHLPAARVAPEEGDVLWLVDASAASFLANQDRPSSSPSVSSPGKQNQ